jgi:two-component system chemotaxis response regulator CheB
MMRMLIVDDSVVFRSQIKAIAEQIPCITEIVLASNGKLALQRLEASNFDIMTLDLEMPEMNGIETLQAMRKLPKRPAVLVFSALSTRGADATIQAMDLGALDFFTKPAQVMNLEEAQNLIRQELLPRISQICQKLEKSNPAATPAPPPMEKAIEVDRVWTRINPEIMRPDAIVMGSSTGGPAALKAVLRSLKAPLPYPIFIAQHMPPLFTKSLADNLTELLGIPAAEATDQEIVKPNRIYVAPGDFHLSLKNRGDKVITILDQKEKRHSVRPAVDTLFESAADVYGARLLGIILTGMGQDGMAGCKSIKDKRGAVIIQDEASSAVWGMPGAVFRQGAYDRIYSLEEMEQLLARTLGRVA